MRLENIRAETDGELKHDGIMLSADSPSVIRDENGVPVEWTLLSVGRNPLIRNGVDGSMTLSAEDMNSIVEYFTKKGEYIPVDSNHYLHELASLKNLDESEVLKLLPSGVAAMGYGSLALSGDDLRFRVRWTPTAYELMKAKIFKYFSPALRGFAKGPLRLTSVAMENEPAINRLDALAAAADARKPPEPGTNTKGSNGMDKIEQALAGLLGRDSVALAADTKKCAGEDSPDGIAAAIDAKAKLISALREGLKLAPEVTDGEVAAALKGALEKAGGYDTVKGELDKVKAEQETSARDALVEKGKAEGKITDATEAWAKTQDSKALSAYLACAPVVVPLDRVKTDALAQTPPDSAALSAEDRAVIKHFGFKEEEYLKTKKGN